jgi:hypothetical protein
LADQRITQLTALPKAGVAATDVLPIADISASQTKKVTAKDLVDAGLDLIDVSSIDLDKLDQASATKLGTTALADDAVTAAKLANDSSIAVQTTAPASDNFEGRGFFNSTSGNLQVFNGSTYQQVVMPTAGIGDLQVTTGKLADGAVTTAKVTALGTAAYADSSVTTAKIADGAVTAAKIATDAITATQVAPNAIGASELADNAVDTAAIVNLAVTEAKLGDGSVTVNKLGSLAVTDAKIAATTISYGKLNLADGSVPGAKIATDSITATQIAAAGVGTSELANTAVTTAKIADAAITAAKIAADSITNAQIAPDAVGVSELANDAVDTAAIVNLAVTEGKLAGGAVTNTKLADLSVTDGKIAAATISYGKLNLADGSVPGGKIATDSITATQIAASGVGTSELGDAAVTTAKLADGAVTAAKIAADSITTAQIAPDAVGASELANDAVDTAAIVDLAVTAAKLGDGAVTEAKIGTAAVTVAKIADATITYAKLNLADGSVPGAKIAADSIAAGQIAANAVNTSELVDGAVTTGKLANNAVTAAKIAVDTITANEIAAGAIGNSELGSAAVTYDKIQNVSATDRLLGRSTAGAGSVEEITCTSAGRALLDDADAATQRATLGLGTIATGNGTWTDGGSFSGTSSGTNTGDQTITLTGDVTGTGTGSFATTITASAVTEAAIATNAVSTGKILANAVTAEKLDDDSAAVVAAASPSGSGAFIGQQWFNTNNGQEFTWTGSAWVQQAGIGTINIVDSTPIAIAVAYPDAYSATLTATLDTQVAATVFAGPTTGADAEPTFRAIVPGDIPDATASTKGIIQPGTGLAVDSGTLNHANTVTGATVSSITFDNQGHITAAIPLVAADIPELDASKITTGELPTARYADASITATKIADYANAQIGETLPVADHIGQFFFNPIEGSVFLWDGNVWQPVGVTTGAITFAGTFDATTPSGIGQVATVTAAGSAAGLVAGSALPAASATNSEYYLVVSNGGTITSGNAPLATLAPPDLVLSNGTSWVEVDVSTGAGAIAASNVSFAAGGDISAVNVQTAIAEVSSECRNADNITSGTLAVARGGTGVASYAKGDLIAASATTTLAKLPVGTNTHVLRANSATATGLEWGADFTGTVTTVSSATAALTVATATTTPALTVRSATTSVDGIVQLSDSTSTTSSVLAATPTAVKSAYDLAALALPKAGGTITGDITLGTNVGIQFEGTTDDANEIRLIGADATADRTITLPNVTGTVITTGDTASVSNTMLATISTAGKVSGTAITSGAMVTSGSIEIVNTSPAFRLTESDGTSTHSQTLFFRNADQFAIQTRDSTGTLVSGDYLIPADASGATDHIWRIANTEKARLDSAGLTLAGYVQTNRIQNVEANEAIVLEPSDDSIQFITNAVERMRLIAGGDLLVGTTTLISPATSTNEGSRISPNVIAVSRSGSVPLFLQRTTDNGTIASFYRQTTQVGTISVTTTATAYNTSSDYRLKENITPLDGAITRLNQLPVHRFNFIADPDTVVDGFIAHEAQEVVPECVTGEKDAVDDDGNPVMQGIDQSKLVPLLTAALQEAVARIESLEARIAALEA